jgi:cytochrome c556
MKRAVGLVILGVVLAASGGIAADAPGAKQQIVDQRVAAMKQMGGKVNEAFQLSGTDAAGARAKLAEALNLAQAIPTRFPAGTGDGDPGVTTRALPKIWSDAAGFQKASDGLVAAMKVADAKLAANDAGGAEVAFGDVRKACGVCHTDYRGPAK